MSPPPKPAISSGDPRARSVEGSLADCLMVPRGAITTFDGQVIDVGGAVWEWRSRPNAGTRHRFDFSLLVVDQLASENSVEVVRWWLARVLTTRKGASASNHVSSLVRFLRWRKRRAKRMGWVHRPLDFTELTAEECIAFNESLLASRQPSRSAPFSYIRSMLRAVAPRLGPLLEQGLVEQLDAVTALRSRQGHAVRTLDPLKGALTDGEVYALRAAADAGRGTELQRSLLRLCLETGMYGEAISDLKSDEIRFEETDVLDRGTGRIKKSRQWIVDRPRVKKGTEARETRELYVTPALGAALHARSRESIYVFPEVRCPAPNGRIATLLTAFARAVGIPNERAGGSLRLSTRRLRYTLGTALAADGQEPEMIAHALDHGHVKEAAAYIEVSRHLVDRVNTMIAPAAERLIKRFRGEIKFEGDNQGRALPIVPNQGPSLDSDRGLSGIGGCGAGTLCRLAWPLSCYACDRFIAWADADHEGVLADLLERQRMFLEGGETRVVAQLSDVILAVQDVIAEVSRRKEETGL